jgi:hypothetical protein
MKIALFVLKLLVVLYLGSLLWFLAFNYEPGNGAFRPPFVLFVLDTINLYIHEAGHFFLKPFGRFIEVLGGSAFQVLLPGLLAFVSWRQNVRTVPWSLFWMGENLVNVSVYIKDAPYRQLKLIAPGLIHDWWWLLDGDPDLAEALGAISFVLGLLVCLAALGLGVYFAVLAYREDVPATPVD